MSQEGEALALFSRLAAAAESSSQLVKRVRRRLPQDGSAERISYPPEVSPLPYPPKVSSLPYPPEVSPLSYPPDVSPLSYPLELSCLLQKPTKLYCHVCVSFSPSAPVWVIT